MLNKLETSWNGPGTITQLLDNNLIINYKNKITRIHIGQIIPFYVSDNVEDSRDFSPSDGDSS